MAEEEIEETEDVPKTSKLPLVLGLVLALLGGGGGFYATWSGMILAPESADIQPPEEQIAPIGDIAFVPVDPLTISLNQGAAARHLIFRAQLEVPKMYQSDVELVLPRVVDVLNNYLRALELSDLESNSALVRLRSQMLRRIQIVTGQGRVNDLLIMEFVLN